MKSSEKNRFQNAFTVCNVALDSVVSDMFGKSATAITDYLISENTFDPDHCVFLLQRSLKKKDDSVLESIEGYSITEEQKIRMMTTGEVWNPSDLFKVDIPDSLKEKQLPKAVKQATKFLQKQGLTVS